MIRIRPFLPVLLCAALVVGTIARGQTAPPAPPPDAHFTAAQLDELLAPVALYPDALLAVMLPATTVPLDVVLAARYLREGGDSTQIDAQPWDASVKALTHYPDVLNWMDENINWTTSVGQAFANQQQDVMTSIQQLRARAQAAGNLTSTPQQNVEVTNGAIRIVPARVDVIYVPVYDPDIVYVERSPDYVGPMFFFSVGWAVGAWLSFDFDWRYRHIWVRDWRPGWTYGLGWRTPWHLNPARPHPPRGGPWPGRRIPRPKPMPGIPHHEAPPPGKRPGSMGQPGRTDESGRGRIVDVPPATPAAPRATPAAPYAPTPAPAAPRGGIFGGYERGADARDASKRGTISRQAPVAPPARVNVPAPRQAQPAPRQAQPAPRQAPAPQPNRGPVRGGQRPR